MRIWLLFCESGDNISFPESHGGKHDSEVIVEKEEEEEDLIITGFNEKT